VRVGRSSLNRLQQSLAGGGTVPWTPDARAVFIELLSTGAAATGALEAMDSVGFLGALVDGWGPVRGLPQRNLYHRYTVDMHLFATVAELTAGRSASDPLVAEAWSRVSDPEPLVLGAFLHDVGKGRGGDHSEIGAELARHAVRRMGLTDERTDDVHFLVREHLWMAETATRRDLNDPATITETARLAGTTDRLAMLFLLTRADALATGPEAWSAFREALVRELYDKAHAVLAGDRGIFGEAPRLAALAAEAGLSVAEAGPLIEGMPAGWLEGTDVQAAARQLAVLSEPLAPGEVRTFVYTGEATDELIVVAHDRPGLLASTAGVLALRGVDVHSADVYTRSGAVAVQIFRTSGAHGSVPPERWERVRTDIADATSGRLDLDEALRRKASHLRVHPTRRGASRVVVDNGLSEGFSVVEVHTRDRLGLLRQVVGTLHRAGCDVHAAKVTTYGTEVVDVFWVRDVGGRRITDPAEVRRINDALLAALDR
jgi:[protein-PII] uridylyltransferase